MKKKVLLLAICFLILSTNAFAELTPSDLENIDKLIQASENRIKQYVDLKINALDAKLSGEIKALGERLTGQINALDAKLSGEIKTVGERINGVEGRLTQIFGFMIALVALIAVAVGLPQILVARQGKEMRIQDQRIEALQQEIEKLKQERIDKDLKI
ncbi:MAG: hypothetical protein OXI43_17740 [Candidatus Poribacteria bacterium]|nr:hypothetical protein [Candidatus Poribacteria bacterium]